MKTKVLYKFLREGMKSESGNKRLKTKPQKVVKVSWAFGNPPYYQIDFGRFEAHKSNTFNVKEDFWERYCDVRFAFEVMQKELMDMIDRGRNCPTPPVKHKRK